MEVVSVLCAARKSVYHDMENVVVYDETRDVRTFGGGTPIVAHPPCRSWSAFCAHQAKPPPGEKELAPLCVDWLKVCGGVLEHPAHSRLWDALNLPKPGEPLRNGLVSIKVWQAWWGYKVKKETWLLLSGVDAIQLDIPFRLHNPRGDHERMARMSKRQRAETTSAFAEFLVSIARQAICRKAGQET